MKIINKLKIFIILQNKVLSVALHLIVVPNIPNIPEPRIPPFELEFEELFCLLIRNLAISINNE